MREGWSETRLKEISSFERGLTYKKGDEVAFSDNVVLRANNVDLATGSLDLSELRHISDAIDIPPNKIVKRGSLIVCTASGSKSHLGKVAFIDDDYGYAFGGFMGQITPSASVDAKFLYWLTRSHIYSDFIAELSDGANINNLKFKQLGELKVPLPPLPEQKRIVAILDEAFEGIGRAVANAEKNLANARELFEQQRNEILCCERDGWTRCALSELTSFKHGYAFKSEFFTKEGPFVLLTPGSFYEQGGYRNQGPKQKFYAGEVPSGFILKEGDFLVAMTEQAVGLLGSPMIVPSGGPFLHNQRLGLVQTYDDVPWENRFFFHVFNTHRFRNAVQQTASGVKVRHTSPSKLGDIEVSFPSSIDEQRTVAGRLDALSDNCDELANTSKFRRANLLELKQSILVKAFSGELSRDPDRVLAEAGA